MSTRLIGLLALLAGALLSGCSGPQATPTLTPADPRPPESVFTLDVGSLESPTAAPTATSTPTLDPTPEPTPTALCDGLGHCWLWGAWRNADESAWTPPPTPTPIPPPSVVRPSTDSPARGTIEGGGPLANCGRFYPERVQYWAATAAQYDWDLCAWANITDCESNGDEWIVNQSSGACGVMQHLPCQYLGDGAGSISLGYQKYAARGWQPWTVGGCYPY